MCLGRTYTAHTPIVSGLQLTQYNAPDIRARAAPCSSGFAFLVPGPIHSFLSFSRSPMRAMPTDRKRLFLSRTRPAGQLAPTSASYVKRTRSTPHELGPETAVAVRRLQDDDEANSVTRSWRFYGAPYTTPRGEGGEVSTRSCTVHHPAGRGW